MDVSIIIPVYKQWALVNDLISKIESIDSEDINKQVLIIDNDPENTREDELPQLSIEGMKVIECSKKGSYAARNQGLNLVDGELIIFTDADCAPDKAWLASLVEAYARTDGNTLLAGDVVISSTAPYPTTAELYDLVAGIPQKRYVSRGYAVTANLAIPRVVFDKVGLFDDSRFSGGDADFCQRALRAGFNLKFVPEAIIYHPARKTWAEYATKVRRMKGGQIRAGKLSRRMKYFCLTLIPPVWRFWRTLQSHKLKPTQKLRVLWFQFRLWGVELTEMSALLCGKTPERR